MEQLCNSFYTFWEIWGNIYGDISEKHNNCEQFVKKYAPILKLQFLGSGGTTKKFL